MPSLLTLFSFLTRHARDLRFSRGLVGLVVITGFLSGLASAGFIALINATINQSMARSVAMWGFIGLCVALPLFRFLSNVLMLRLVQRVLRDLRIQLARRILEVPLRHLEEIGPAGLLGTLTEDVASIVNAIGIVPLLVLHTTVVLGCLIYLGWLSWQLLLIFLAFLVVGIFTYQLPLLRAQRHFRLMRESWDRLLRTLRGLTEGSKELKLHAPRRRAFVLEALEPAAAMLERHTVAGSTIYAAAGSWGQVLFFVVIGLLLFLVPSYQEISAQTMTGYMFALLYMMTPLDTILNLLPNLGRATVAIRKVESLGLSLQEKTGDADALVVPPAVPSWQRIELSGISHAYRREGEDDSFLLGPVDLGVNAGETLFLVGGNGSGKTTLAKLLMGLYMPEQGEIRLDGKAVTNLDRDSYRQLFSAVFADFYLFETLLGLDRTGLDEQALKYLSDLHLADKVKVKDGTLSTLDLSQGQRKRLALLTAYLEDRPIYLFDEWAADQDPYFKEIFYTQLLRELKTRRKTIVVISHDDRYYHLADRIVKLEYGKVVYDGEFGSYLEIAKDMAEPQTPPAA